MVMFEVLLQGAQGLVRVGVPLVIVMSAVVMVYLLASFWRKSFQVQQKKKVVRKRKQRVLEKDREELMAESIAANPSDRIR